MNEQVGENLKIISTSIDKTIFDMGRNFLYDIWKFLYSVETSVFKSFELLLTKNPLKSAIGTELYNIVFTIGIVLLILASSFMILINIVSNKPIENKNVIWQLMISIAVLASTPTLIKEMSNIGLNTSTLMLKDVKKVGNESIYRNYFKDMELSVKEDTMKSIDADVVINKLMINKTASKDIIKNKPKALKKAKDGTYTWEVEKINNNKTPFIGIMDVYKYKVDWFPLYLTTLFSVGVSLFIMLKVTSKSLNCLFKSYLAPLWQSIKQGHLQAIEFLGDFKNDMLFIFLSVLSLFFFRTALVEVLLIKDFILMSVSLIALSIVSVNLANNVLNKISGGSFKDEQANLAGAAGAGLVMKGAKITKNTPKNIANKIKSGTTNAKNIGKGIKGAKQGIGKAKQGMDNLKQGNAQNKFGKQAKDHANNALKNGEIGKQTKDKNGVRTHIKNNGKSNSQTPKSKGISNQKLTQSYGGSFKDLKGNNINISKSNGVNKGKSPTVSQQISDLKEENFLLNNSDAYGSIAEVKKNNEKIKKLEKRR